MLKLARLHVEVVSLYVEFCEVNVEAPTFARSAPALSVERFFLFRLTEFLGLGFGSDAHACVLRLVCWSRAHLPTSFFR